MNNKILSLVLILLAGYYLINLGSSKKESSFFDSSIVVKNTDTNNLSTYKMEEYLIGVLAGEMPASFDIEALKAQAIASRSYAYYQKENAKENYDLTNDISSQIYLTKKQMQEKWQDDFEYYLDIVTRAVNETKDLVLSFENKVISAYYFSMSNGYTENSITVFNEDKEYLQSVASKEDTQNKNFKQEVSLDKKEFCNKLQLSCDQIIIKDIIKNETDHVSTISVNNHVFTGIEMRKMLNLRSTDFEINISDKVNIITYGYGHGVGMSQYGANTMAKEGYTYEEILKHYYRGTEIQNISSII